MNETANATLALGALPVMAHAREEVEEMVGLAGALVLNIGTLSPPWVDAMLLAARRRRTSAACRSCSTRSAPARRGYRTETAKRILDEVDVDGRCAATRPRSRRSRRRGGDARRRVDRRGRRRRGAGARGRARTLGVVASVTGPVDHVSDGERVIAVANGHPLLATITGTGCMSTAMTGCFLAVAPDRRSRRLPRRSSPSASPARTPRGTRRAPARSTSALYDALCNLDPATLDGAREASTG